MKKYFFIVIYISTIFCGCESKNSNMLAQDYIEFYKKNILEFTKHASQDNLSFKLIYQPGAIRKATEIVNYEKNNNKNNLFDSISYFILEIKGDTSSRTISNLEYFKNNIQQMIALEINGKTKESFLASQEPIGLSSNQLRFFIGFESKLDSESEFKIILKSPTLQTIIFEYKFNQHFIPTLIYNTHEN